MDITKTVAKMRFKYHTNMLDVNNVLNQLGLRKDEKAEACAKKHMMTIFTDCLPRMGYDVEGYFKKQKEEEGS